jgi:hypothetical protein
MRDGVFTGFLFVMQNLQRRKGSLVVSRQPVFVLVLVLLSTFVLNMGYCECLGVTWFFLLL